VVVSGGRPVQGQPEIVGDLKVEQLEEDAVGDWVPCPPFFERPYHNRPTHPSRELCSAELARVHVAAFLKQFKHGEKLLQVVVCRGGKPPPR